MFYVLKQLKCIVCLLAIIILSQSCIIVYKCKPSTIEQAALRKNTRIKIKTKHGEKYKTRWIEEKDGKVFSISNTKRVYIDKEKIGTIQNKHKLINIENKGDYIQGLKPKGKDTFPMEIPVGDIEVIKITNRGVSIPLNIVGWGTFSILGGYGLFVALWYLDGSI